MRRMEDDYQKKLYVCYVDMEKAFDRVSRKGMEWIMIKKGLLEAMFRAVINFYNEAKTRVRVGSAYIKEFKVKVGVHQGSALLPQLFAVMADVITENARQSVIVKYYTQMTLFS